MNFGLDLGYGAVKLAGAFGSVELPSHIATGGGPIAADLAGVEAAERPLLISMAGHQPYWCGLGAHAYGRAIENLDYDKLAGSVEMRALLYAALTKYMHQCHIVPETTEVTLYAGLPLEPLSGDEASKVATVASVRRWLVGTHCWQANGQTYRLKVKAAPVATQAMGAYFDYMLDDNGHFLHPSELAKEVGVISIGFNTLEMQVFQGSRFIPRFTSGSQYGVRRLLERVNGRYQGLYTLGELDERLRLNNLEIQQDMEDWSQQVWGRVEKQWGREWRRFSHVILVGGGARLLNDRFLGKLEGRASLPNEPVMAIAQGLYKLASVKEK